jgi:Formyl transferase
MPADLLIGGTLGGWALGQADPADVAHVVTDDPTLARAAAALGLAVRHDHEYEPSGRALSVHYKRILPAALIARSEGIWNLHPGLLPWGRGTYPVFWALWERTPAGATLHELVQALDAGPIVAQTEVPVLRGDTGLAACTRPAGREGPLRRILAADRRRRGAALTPQSGAGSYHTLSEFPELKEHGTGARLARCLQFP